MGVAGWGASGCSLFAVMRKYYNITTYYDVPRRTTTAERPRKLAESPRNARGTLTALLRRILTYYDALRRTTTYYACGMPTERPRKLACHCDGPLPAKPPRELLLHLLRRFLLPLKRRLLRLLSGQSIESFLRGLSSIQTSICMFQICVSVVVP